LILLDLEAKEEENPKDSDLGAFWFATISGLASWKGENIQKLRWLASDVGQISAKNLSDEIRNVMSGTRFSVVMPAGEVFGFSGLDTTSDGAFYTHISYATPQGGTQVK
jgi:hypothetical protein